MTISERMFKIMEERNITQYKLSKMTGISQQTISDWRIKKTNPGADKIMLICAALGVSSETLLIGEIEESQKCLDFIDLQTEAIIEHQIIQEYRKLSDNKRKRLLAYINMLQNSKE